MMEMLYLSSTCVCAFGYAPLVSDVRPCPKVLSAQLSRWLCPASPARALGPAGDAAGASARPMRFIRRMRLTYASAARSQLARCSTTSCQLFHGRVCCSRAMYALVLPHFFQRPRCKSTPLSKRKQHRCRATRRGNMSHHNAANVIGVYRPELEAEIIASLPPL